MVVEAVEIERVAQQERRWREETERDAQGRVVQAQAAAANAAGTGCCCFGAAAAYAAGAEAVIF